MVLNTDELDARCRMFLFLADRAEHTRKVIIPNITKTIITDRSMISGIAYSHDIGVPYHSLVDMSKLAKVMTDNAKVAIRNIRQNSNTKIKNLLKDKLITEDDSKKAQDEVQKITDGFVAKADETLKTKEKEILTV
jgi:thymidylate kinase